MHAFFVHGHVHIHTCLPNPEVFCHAYRNYYRIMLFSLNTDFTGLIQDQAKLVACKKSVDIDITIEDFERRFRSLQKEILSQLVKRGIDPATVINSLTLLPLKLRKEYKKAIQELLPSLPSKEGIDKFFVHLNPLFSFLDYGLLEYIIKEYGSDTLVQDMR